MIKPRTRKIKGSNFEREIASILTDQLGVKCKRVLLSGVRGEGDVEGLNQYKIECKRQERLNLYKWWEQAKKEQAQDGKTPVLIFKSNHKDTLVTIDLQTFIDLIRESI